VNRKNFGYRLHLNDDAIIHHKVQPVPTFNKCVTVSYRYGNLYLEANSSMGELPAQTGLVCRLKQTRSEPAVHFDGRRQDFVSANDRRILCVLCGEHYT
jgi:hypothetical protein